MVDKLYISCSDFDNLSEYEKMHFKFCTICGKFYNVGLVGECQHE